VEARTAATIADGIAIKRPGALTLPLVSRWVDDLVVVAEDDVAEAMVRLLERAKLVVEGAGAVGVAALLTGAVRPAARGTTAVVLSGGNVDAGLLATVARRHETAEGRRLRLFTRISDRPGGLAGLLGHLAEAGGNLVTVEHVREAVPLHVRQTGVDLVLETRGADHAEAIVAALHAAGYEVDRYEGETWSRAGSP
jgi:threonine dehydratase